MTCPDEGVTPAKLGLPRNLTAEQYFNLLAERAAEQEKQQKQEQGKGQSDEENEAEGDTESQEGQEQDGGEEDKTDTNEQTGNGDDEAMGQDAGDGTGESDPMDEGQSGETPTETDKPPEGAEEIGGSCADGQPRPWEDGPPSEEHPGLQEHEQNLIEAATAKAIEDYQEQRGRGSVPGGLARQATDKLHPRIDPARELLAKIKYDVGSTSGFGAFTYQKPNRRQPRGGALLPAHVKPIPKVIVAVDSSGSMGEKDIALAMGIISNALRSIPDPRGVRVLVGDTQVQSAKSVFRAEQVEVSGGGGTDMEELIRAACEEKPKPKAIILVTDGECHYGKEPIGVRVVVCLTRKSRYCDPPPAWCDTVILNPEEQ